MHDIRLIRDNPAEFDAAMKMRGLEPQAERLIDLDARRRAATTRLLAEGGFEPLGDGDRSC